VTGPLAGRRIVELAGIGPGPFAAMMLSDMGAEVLRVDRHQAVGEPAARWDVNARGRRSVGVDLKHPEGREVVLRLVERADALIEGFRPGVTERLGLGPDDCLARQPTLVYGRMTGWGQDGPWAQMAGRDIDYIALAGTLGMMGPGDAPPVPPLTLVGDFGGGGMLLAFGIVCGLLAGEGQVVDAAMLDGAALLAAMFHGMRADGRWGERGTNLLDGSQWFYATYETADGGHVAVGAIDPRAQAAVLAELGVEPDGVADAFRTRTRDEWAAAFEGTDACVAPVLDPDEAPSHPHLQARGTFTEVDGIVQPAPAPRFSHTPPAVQGPPPAPGQHTDEALADWGFSAGERAALRQSGAICGK
jgi:alpha-methylacyl-CoA racemase